MWVSCASAAAFSALSKARATASRQPVIFVHERSVTERAGCRWTRVEIESSARATAVESTTTRVASSHRRDSTTRDASGSARQCRNTGRSGRSSPATRLGSAIPPRPLESDTISEQTCTPLLSPLTGVQNTRASATTSLSSSRPSAMIAREGRLYGSDATTSTIWSACSRRSQKTTRSSMCVRTPRPLPDVSCSRRSASVASIVESVTLTVAASASRRGR